MLIMDYEERQIIKKVIEKNLTRPADMDVTTVAKMAAYRANIKSSMELMRIIIDPKRPIVVIAPTQAIAMMFNESLGKKYKCKFMHDHHTLRGLSDYTLINLVPLSSSKTYQNLRLEIFDIARTQRGVDFWNVGDF